MISALFRAYPKTITDGQSKTCELKKQPDSALTLTLSQRERGLLG
jgi:hypothetical protein